MEKRDYESENNKVESLEDYHRRAHDNYSTYGCYFEHPETAGDFYFEDERKIDKINTFIIKIFIKNKGRD